MHAEQTEFENSLTDIASEVDSLGSYKDIDKVDAIALHVRSVKEKIADAQSKSLVFMNRQSIFGANVAPLARTRTLTPTQTRNRN